jgi:hypothetical protein
MDLRIGVIHTAREINFELPDDFDREAFKARVEAAIAGKEKVLWVPDRQGREVAVPTDRIAYVELGSPDAERRVGFGH